MKIPDVDLGSACTHIDAHIHKWAPPPHLSPSPHTQGGGAQTSGRETDLALGRSSQESHTAHFLGVTKQELRFQPCSSKIHGLEAWQAD